MRQDSLYLPNDTPLSERRICQDILRDLEKELLQYNPYVRDFLRICETPEEEIQDAAFVISEKERPAEAGSRTYTSHNLSEVSVMMPDAIGNRDIVVRKRGGGIQEFKDTNRAADPLHFVLLHSRGADEWSPDLKLQRNVRVVKNEAEDG